MFSLGLLTWLVVCFPDKLTEVSEMEPIMPHIFLQNVMPGDRQPGIGGQMA